MEVLAVIAIIGVLLGLLLPAVQSAREAARRVSCGNGGRQCGIAIHSFYSAHDRFPRLGKCQIAEPAKNMPALNLGDETLPIAISNYNGWILAILPYLEETARYDQWKSGVTPAQSLEKGPIRAIECPSSRSAFDALIREISLPADWPVSCWGAVLGCNPSELSVNRSGIVVSERGTSPITRDTVKDGLSNTAMLGEITAHETATGKFRSTYASSFTGTRKECLDSTPTVGARDAFGLRCFTGEMTAVNMTWIPKSRSCGRTGNSGGLWFSDSGGIVASRHPGGSHIVMGDGAVKFVDDDVDCGQVGGDPWAVQYYPAASPTNPKGVWGAISTRAGGEAARLD